MSKVIIDTREPFEFAASHVEGAINISPAEFIDGTFLEKLKSVPKNTPIILYCRSGARSNTCGMFLRNAGFTDLTNGINEGRVRQLTAEGGEV